MPIAQVIYQPRFHKLAVVRHGIGDQQVRPAQREQVSAVGIPYVGDPDRQRVLEPRVIALEQDDGYPVFTTRKTLRKAQTARAAEPAP